MRVRLLMVAGVVACLVGAATLAVAITWLSGAHVFDPQGQFGKQIAVARFGGTLGGIGLLFGLASLTTGAVIWRRRTSSIRRRDTP